MFKYLVPAALAFPIAAQAQTVAEPAPAEGSPVTVSGSVTLTSDYRFRGVSQSDQQIAVQDGLTVSHGSGVYIGAWASNLAGWGTFGGASLELDLIAGYRAKLADHAPLDVGAVWYMYPGGADKNLTLGVAWIDTDISDRDAAYLQPSFSKGQDGTGNIAGSTFVVSLNATL